ncbi:PTS galactosamine/N-acetylgalactosamine transporter subunit IIA [Vibrio sp. HN007]|uniref:PTS galactosamine/N-acetylgalactosamine transporter subunit IIA n=1 Tax=Vibrio iocasae TaxID=3098914 RepID=UPI0035D4167D
MLTVILSGHGGFATGLEKAINQIIGEQEQFRAIDFPPEATTPELEQSMRTALTELHSDDGVVFMTDLLGGTPFRSASLLSQEHDNMEVIAGTNLQMAAEMLLDRDDLTAREFVKQALECGHRGITSLSEQLASSAKQETADDGI